MTFWPVTLGVFLMYVDFYLTIEGIFKYHVKEGNWVVKWLLKKANWYGILIWFFMKLTYMTTLCFIGKDVYWLVAVVFYGLVDINNVIRILREM